MGDRVDSGAFDSDVRQLAEGMAWQDRPDWVARRIVRHNLHRTATDADVAALTPCVRSYVTRLEPGTGHIESTLRDLSHSSDHPL